MSAGRRVLLTGFEPFEGEPVNPSAELVARWRENAPAVEGLELLLELLPVDRARLHARLDELLDSLRPQAWLAMGQHARSGRVELECRARNRLHYKGRVDNGGHRAHEETLEADGPPVRESNLPIPELAGVLRRDGLPVSASDDAGSHLCNATLYHLLGRDPAPRASFVHLPLLPEQAERRGKREASLPLHDQERCVLALLQRLAPTLSSLDPDLPHPRNA